MLEDESKNNYKKNIKEILQYLIIEEEPSIYVQFMITMINILKILIRKKGYISKENIFLKSVGEKLYILYKNIYENTYIDNMSKHNYIIIFISNILKREILDNFKNFIDENDLSSLYKKIINSKIMSEYSVAEESQDIIIYDPKLYGNEKDLESKIKENLEYLYVGEDDATFSNKIKKLPRKQKDKHRKRRRKILEEYRNINEIIKEGLVNF